MKQTAWSPLALLLLLALAPFTEAASKTAKKIAPEVFPAEVDFTSVPKVAAGSAIVVDAETGQVLHAVNADQERPVASTQKLLTALIIAEAGDLQRKVKVQTSDTQAEPTKLYVKPGELYSRYDFLNVLLVHSMNDVALALARDNAGSVKDFAAKMNKRAAELGMRSSNFVNPNGLPAKGQFSTARDMARVAMIAYRNPTIRAMVRMKSITWRYNDGRVREFSTTNRVLKNYALCNGMKTGYTEAAGRCLISSASVNGRHVIVVVLGDTRSNVWIDSYRLLAWGLQS